jgi:hypothetical protein
MIRYCICGHREDSHSFSGCIKCQKFGKELIFRNEYTYRWQHEFRLDKERKLI